MAIRHISKSVKSHAFQRAHSVPGFARTAYDLPSGPLLLPGALLGTSPLRNTSLRLLEVHGTGTLRVISRSLASALSAGQASPVSRTGLPVQHSRYKVATSAHRSRSSADSSRWLREICHELLAVSNSSLQLGPIVSHAGEALEKRTVVWIHIEAHGPLTALGNPAIFVGHRG